MLALVGETNWVIALNHIPCVLWDMGLASLGFCFSLCSMGGGGISDPKLLTSTDIQAFGVGTIFLPLPEERREKDEALNLDPGSPLCKALA